MVFEAYHSTLVRQGGLANPKQGVKTMATPRKLLNDEYRDDIAFKEEFPESELNPDRTFLFWLTCRHENQRAQNAAHKAVLFANL